MRSKWMIVKLSDRHRFCDGRLAVFHRVGRDAVHLIDCNKRPLLKNFRSNPALTRTNRGDADGFHIVLVYSGSVLLWIWRWILRPRADLCKTSSQV